MRPLWTLLVERGIDVTGSDERFLGHNAAEVDGRSCLIYSTAIGEDNVEMQAALTAGIPAVHRAQALNAVLQGRRWTGVTGSHGKTLTAAALAHILDEGALDPTWYLGGQPLDRQLAHLGLGEVGVAELDESDRSILLTAPPIAVITNIDDDHMEVYKDYADLQATLKAWALSLGRDAQVVLCLDDGGTLMLADELAEEPNAPALITYGRSNDADVRIVDIQPTPNGRGSVVTVETTQGSRIRFDLKLIGEHQALDAIGAATAATLYGVGLAQSAQALSTFTGAQRRLNPVGNAGGVQVLDSYAHHPTAIRADIAAARLTLGDGGTVVLAFQASGLERVTRTHAEIAHAVGLADEIVLLPLHTSVTDARAGHLVPLIATALQDRVHDTVDTLQEAAVMLADLADKGDVVLLMGAGDVTDLGPLLLKELDSVNAA
jgi:UDP-N-acetylmuramate--alanine ligase